MIEKIVNKSQTSKVSILYIIFEIKLQRSVSSP